MRFKGLLSKTRVESRPGVRVSSLLDRTKSGRSQRDSRPTHQVSSAADATTVHRGRGVTHNGSNTLPESSHQGVDLPLDRDTLITTVGVDSTYKRVVFGPEGVSPHVTVTVFVKEEKGRETYLFTNFSTTGGGGGDNRTRRTVSPSGGKEGIPSPGDSSL